MADQGTATRIAALLDGGEHFQLAHPRARERFPDERNFFYDCADDLAPFGSDAGDTALHEYLEWRKDNPDSPLLDCLVWAIESVGEMDADDYDEALCTPEAVAALVADEEFDDAQFVWTLDLTVIATGFGQLLVEGEIDDDAQPIIALALRRQVLYARAQPQWPHAAAYIGNLEALLAALGS